MFDTVILIPTYNEKKSLTKIIKEINSRFKIIVIDDCSNDGTLDYLRSNKIEFLFNKKNLGYEVSLIKGMKYIVAKYKFMKNIITFDADGEHRVTDLERLEKYQEKNNYDLIVCKRNRFNRFSEIIISMIFKKKYNINDPLSGFKLYRADKLKFFNKNISSYFFLVDLLKIFLVNKCNVANFNIYCNKIKRQPKVGSWFFVNLKILNIIRII